MWQAVEEHLVNEHIHLNALQGNPAQTPQALPRVSLWRRKAWNPEAEGEDAEHGREDRAQPAATARAETTLKLSLLPQCRHMFLLL